MTMWPGGVRFYALLAVIALVLALPFVLRPPGCSSDAPVIRGMGTDQLVIITPHLEAVRRKFGRAFTQWYARNYHRSVSIEYLVFGGGEIVKYLQAGEAAYRRSGTYSVDVVWGGSDSMFNDV